MRSIPIPVDVSRLTFVVVTDPRPRLVSQETGEVKTDRNGQTVYQVGLSAAVATGRVELVNVSISGEPSVKVGQVVVPAGLVGFVWEQPATASCGGASPTAPTPSRQLTLPRPLLSR